MKIFLCRLIYTFLIFFLFTSYIDRVQSKIQKWNELSSSCNQIILEHLQNCNNQMGNIIERCCPIEQDKSQGKRSSKKVVNVVDNANTTATNFPNDDYQFPPDEPQGEETISDEKIGQILKKKAKIKTTKRTDIDDFQIDGILGKGGFGVVYTGQLKENKENGIIEKYAIKKVSKETIFKKRVYANAIDEKNILAMYKCKFIVALVMAFQDPEYIYFVMQCATAGDTYSLIQQNSPSPKVQAFKALGEDAVRFIAGCVILGLEFLHQNNYMYRDLKPENVLLFDNGYVKLTDFGLAKKSLEGISSKTIAGTQLYYAPEMVLRKGYGKEIDYWTLGVYLYELSVYQPPFAIEQITRPRFQAACLEAECDRNWHKAKLSPNLKDLINSILKFDPSTRLGVNGWEEVKNHAFFEGFDWKSLAEMKMESPLKALAKNYPVKLKAYKPDPPRQQNLDQLKKLHMDGWTYKREI